jgi:hypothetical protein
MHDERHRAYLASYLKTAQRFLAELPVPDAALLACEHTLRSIDRERAMTCEALRPIAQPARELVLPRGLTLSGVAEHIDPTNDAPMANVLTAVREAHAR